MNEHTKPTSEAKTDGADSYERLHRLVMRTLEDPDTPEHTELASLLAGDPEAQDVYVAYMHDTSVLRAHALCEVTDDAWATAGENLRTTASPDSSPRSTLAAGERHFSWGTLAAALALTVTGGLLSASWWQDDASGVTEIATIVRVTDVAWDGKQTSTLRPLTRVPAGQELQFGSGQVEMVFDSGVELLVTGPAAMSIESPLKVVASRGVYTARVGETGKGFTIDTPATSVTDLGTEFGVSIESDQSTGVVVFDGEVDVTPHDLTAEHTDESPIRLKQGEALAITLGGRAERIVAMYPGQYPTVAGRPGAGHPEESLFAEVTDNLSGSESKKFYRILPSGFDEDARAFVDRCHEWNGVDDAGLPEFLVGGDYVMPFNDYKYLDGLEVTVRMRAPCMLYVLFDTNMATPDWLLESFKDTGERVGLDHGLGPFTGESSPQVGPGKGVEDQFAVWSKRIDGPTEVLLGGAPEPADKQLGWNMYGMVAAPLSGVEEGS
ncbi:MAG: FecR domain-containing protein [Planctomycetota bacterium]